MCTAAPCSFTIAAAGPKAMRLAARYGQTWVTYGPLKPHTDAADWFDQVRRQVQRIDAICEQLGRDPRSLRRMALVGLELHWAQSSVDAGTNSRAASRRWASPTSRSIGRDHPIRSYLVRRRLCSMRSAVA